MALQEPERDTIQFGGLQKFRKRKITPPSFKGIGTKFTSTLKKVQKKLPSSKSTKKLSLVKRLGLLKIKALAKKIGKSTKLKTAVKKVVKKASSVGKKLVKKAVITTRKVKASVDVKTQFAKAKVKTLKKTAKAKAARIGSDLRTRLLRESTTTRGTKMVSLRNKLAKLNDMRNDKLLGTKRGGSIDIMNSSSISHKNSLALLGSSDNNVRNLNRNVSENITNAGSLTRNRGNLLSNITVETNNRASLSNGLSGIGSRRNGLQADAVRFASNAETARVGAANNLTSINAAIASRDATIAPVATIFARKTKRQSDATLAGGDAVRHNAVQRGASDLAIARERDRGGHNSARNNAAADSRNYNDSKNLASARKNINENNLSNVQTTHRAMLNTVKSNADNAVADINGKLNTTGTSKMTNQNNFDTTTQLRRLKEGEITQTRTNITNKTAEVDTAVRHENSAINAYNANVSDLTSKNRNLVDLKREGVELSTNKNRSLNDAESKRPIRTTEENINKVRRGVINDTEIPDLNNRRAVDRSRLNSYISDNDSPTRLRNKIGDNNSEITKIGTDRQRVVSENLTRSLNKGRLFDDIQRINRLRDGLVGEVSLFRAIKQKHLEHLDGVQGFLDAHRQSQNRGITIGRRYEDMETITTARQNSITMGTTHSSNHAINSPSFFRKSSDVGTIKLDLSAKSNILSMEY